MFDEYDDNDDVAYEKKNHASTIMEILGESEMDFEEDEDERKLILDNGIVFNFDENGYLVSVTKGRKKLID